MLIDTRDLADDTVLRTRLAIVGAGAAGITIARSLAGSGIDVVLVESGGLDPDDATQDLYKGDLVGAPFHGAGNEIQLDEVRLRYFGGTTNHWTGFCRPLEPVDFETRDYLGLSGWPITRPDLDPFYDRAIEVIRLASPHFDLAWWQEHHDVGAALFESDLVDTTMFQVHLGFSWGRAYRDELDAASDVRVLLWANATRLAVGENSGRIDSVDLQTLSGVRVRVEADVFVVALGGIETPRLLLASNDVRPAGVGNGRDLVGRHFAEHLRAQVGHVVLDATAQDLRVYQGHDIAAAYPDAPDNTISAQASLTMSRQAMLADELLGCEVQFTFVRASDALAPHLFADGVPIDAVLELNEAVDGQPPATVAYVQVLAEQELQPDSRVTIGRETDALGMPRIQLDWRHTTRDRASIVRSLEILGAELGRTATGRLLSLPGGMGYMEDPEPDDFPFVQASAAAYDPEAFELGVGFHHMSTCRMSASGSTGVVDADCRVHELDNLYLAGSSVFATAATATPTLTITALALRLADHLRQAMS